MTPTDPWSVPEELLITDAAAVEILWTPSKRRHLKPFIGKSAGLSDAARELGITKTAMSYWVGRLRDAGLIRSRQVEGGVQHSLPRYRCVADRLRVDLKDAPLSSYEGVLDDFDARWYPLTRKAMGQSIARQAAFLDLTIESNGAAGIITQIVPRDSERAPPDDFVYYWARLWLTSTERDQLRADLDELWNKYAVLSNREVKHHPTLFHLVAAPEATR